MCKEKMDDEDVEVKEKEKRTGAQFLVHSCASRFLFSFLLSSSFLTATNLTLRIRLSLRDKRLMADPGVRVCIHKVLGGQEYISLYFLVGTGPFIECR